MTSPTLTEIPVPPPPSEDPSKDFDFGSEVARGVHKRLLTGLTANLLMTLEALSNIVGIALSTGIVFARVSRLTAKIIFSRHAVVATYRGGRARSSFGS